MKTTIYFFIVLITLFIMQSCKKDPIDSDFSKSLIWASPLCEDVSDSTLLPTVPSVIVEKGSQFKYPAFNPLNSYELVYFEQVANVGETPSESGKLVKYNYQSNVKTTLVNSVALSGSPAWNENGWIAYETTSSQIYIIRDNGTDLMQFTTHSGFNGYNQHVTWVNGGNSLLWKYLNYGSGEIYLLQKTIGQQETDTLYHGELGFFQFQMIISYFLQMG
ncbi:MAG: hypothetical protein M9916_04875 [Crocinitomicaceae bacterium]|nr:hypothetical protein [Crocinitomicaceae bacterium]